ncbi:MAG: TPM domain-containing protein [Bacteroidia bacterium]|nr:TPM domain-containing protein [Bacteroidia bacterium]
MNAPDLFKSADREAIRSAVFAAEQLTSGEIRVYIDDECKTDVLDRAAFVFAELGMQNTELRNGVLIYIAMRDHKFAIIGDAGIHKQVGDPFWSKVREEMGNHFREGKFTEGIRFAVTETGKKLKEFYPRSAADINELPDDMIFGKGDQG